MNLIIKYQKKDIYPQERQQIIDELMNVIMEYQKIANLLDDASNQPTKFRTKNWVEINDE